MLKSFSFSSIDFRAAWHPKHSPSDLESRGPLQKVISKIKNILLFLPNSLVAACFNPRSEALFIRADDQHFSSPGRGFAQTIITPDGVRLAAYIRLVNEGPNTPTVILFNPWGCNAGIHDRIADQFYEKRCNVVTFNYRGLKDTKRAEDFVVDGESVYQFVSQKIQSDANKIHFYGVSLGGAVAAQVKALHPESKGKYVGDRPFASVFSLITEFFSVEKLGPIVQKITSAISAIFLAYPVYLLGWEWDGKQALEQMKGEKIITYHPEDALVSQKASLALQCSDSTQILSLEPTLPPRKGFDAHFAPISAFYSPSLDQPNPLHIITNFLSQN